MLTQHEAHQHVSHNRMTLRRIGANWLIHPIEGNKRAGFDDYSSDDLEDVVLKSGSLRRG